VIRFSIISRLFRCQDTCGHQAHLWSSKVWVIPNFDRINRSEIRVLPVRGADTIRKVCLHINITRDMTLSTPTFRFRHWCADSRNELFREVSHKYVYSSRERQVSSRRNHMVASYIGKRTREYQNTHL